MNTPKLIRIVGALVTVGVLASCSGADERAEEGRRSFAESMRLRGSHSFRGVIELSKLNDFDYARAPVLVEGRIVDVRADRGWVNLDESQIKGSIDIRAVPFESPEAAFRTILVSLEVGSVLRDGGSIVTPRWRKALAAGGRLDVTFVMQNDTTLEAAKVELPAFGDVVIPVEEGFRGAFGRILEPSSGWDILVDVGRDGSLSMPLADASISKRVLRGVDTRAELMTAVRGGRRR